MTVTFESDEFINLRVRHGLWHAFNHDYKETLLPTRVTDGSSVPTQHMWHTSSAVSALDITLSGK